MTAPWAPAQTATVFGGTGFLGRRVVRRLWEAGFAVRIAARHPERGRSLSAAGEHAIASIRADINEESGVAAAIGNGGTRLQPVYAADIGEAVARIMRLPATKRIYELAGPELFYEPSGRKPARSRNWCGLARPYG